MGRKIDGFATEFMDLLLNYDFPGNVQELKDIVATSVINTEREVVGVDSLAHYMRDILTSGRRGLVSFHPRKLDEVVRDHVNKTVRYTGGDRSKAAVELGIKPEELNDILDHD
jgi:DNA-binding NtrC family response regulator